MCGAALAGLALAACGGGQEQSASEPKGDYPVEVSAASFPSTQRLAENTHLRLTIRNSGGRTIPDIAVTLLNPKDGTGAQAFGQDLDGSRSEELAGRSRPVWVIDQPPGPCQYSCRQGGLGGAVTSDANTWALGKLAPGRTATFDWAVTPVQPGRYVVEYQVAAGLTGNARAVDGGGGQPTGRFAVDVVGAPRQAYVSNGGQVVSSG